MSLVWNLLPPIHFRTILICIAWYFVSAVTSQLTKTILARFPYPLILTQFQFLSGVILSLVTIILVRKYPRVQQHFPPGSIPNEIDKPIFQVKVLFKILPLGVFQFSAKFLTLLATSLVSLLTVSSLKALSPLLIVAGYKITYKVSFPIVTYFSLAPLVGGVIMIIVSDSKGISNTNRSIPRETNGMKVGHVKGLIYGTSSAIICAAQSIYGKELFTWDSNSNRDPVSLALDMELVKPQTPNIIDDHDGDNEYFGSVPQSAANKYTRKRTNSIRLPFTNFDIKDQERRGQSLGVSLYDKKVQRSFEIVKSPLSLFNAFSADVNKPDKMSITFYISLIGFCFSSSGIISNEVSKFVKYLWNKGDYISSNADHEKINILPLLGLIILDSLSHFLQTLLAFHLLGLIPALSYSIASMLKRIVIITVSILLAVDSTRMYNDKTGSGKLFSRITNGQIGGLFLIGIGLYSYDRWGSKRLKSHK